MLINHTCTKISEIPESAIIQAKEQLHIAYSHTSHGSQLTNGMSGLVPFMNARGVTNNLYAWEQGGAGGALDMHDDAMGSDVGYYPGWVDKTRSYLGAVDPQTGRGTGKNGHINVVIWSWCGQVSEKYKNGTLNSQYLEPMSQLESEYFGIRFVYMTGHLDHAQDADNKGANQAIRTFCAQNNKVLYDFADIESYDPDGNFYQYANDDCSYYSSTGTALGNWATEWQASHTKGVDWYECSSAHSQPLNANLKAYAAWWLWASLAGWDSQATAITSSGDHLSTVSIHPGSSNGFFVVKVPRSEIRSVELYNAVGSKLFSAMLAESSAEMQIDLSSHRAGLYFLKVNLRSGVWSQKLRIER